MSDSRDDITANTPDPVADPDDALVEDYVDEALKGDALSEFEVRMQSDLVLRRQVTELRSLKSDLTALPRDASVPGRVWEGIQARIQEAETASAKPAHEPAVIALSSGAASREKSQLRQRRFSFSAPQLAAAAVVLVSLGGALTWAAASPSQGLPTAIPTGAVSQVATTPEDDAVEALFTEYETSSAALMEIIDDGAPVLSDETIRIVRESVDAIDQAVSEAREALKQDPGSEMLNRILLSNMQKKLDLLRSTAAAVQSMA